MYWENKIQLFIRFKDGEEITASSRYKTLYDEETEAASLVIKNLSLEDSGEYNIIAKNEVGTASQFVNLHVKGAFTIWSYSGELLLSSIST